MMEPQTDFLHDATVSSIVDRMIGPHWQLESVTRSNDVTYITFLIGGSTPYTHRVRISIQVDELEKPSNG